MFCHLTEMGRKAESLEVKGQVEKVDLCNSPICIMPVRIHEQKKVSVARNSSATCRMGVIQLHINKRKRQRSVTDTVKRRTQRHHETIEKDAL